jgi:hypothetical protein
MIGTLKHPGFRAAIVFLFMGILLAAFQSCTPVVVSTSGGVIMALPSCVGEFYGKPTEISEGERYVLPKDTEIIKKAYTDPLGDIVNVQIVLAGAEKRSIHRPELCLPAQGWSISGRETIPITLSDGRKITVMMDTITRQVEVAPGVNKSLTSLFCYWFIGDGTTTYSHFMRIFLTSWDRVIHGKNHRWAYAAVSAPVLQGFKRDGFDPVQTQVMVTEFISRLAPHIMINREKTN